jgi:hypothetical protein
LNVSPGVQQLAYWVRILGLWAFGLSLLGARAQADSIPAGYRQIAEESGVPASLLYAMALAESGRQFGANGGLRPWPWSLNVGGKGYLFETREAAWAALEAFLAQGKRSIDIGLMQVNWKYHGKRLKNAYLALDPYYNLRVAAGIFRDCYRVRGDWWSAVACYHAPSPDLRARRRADRYRARVQGHWQQLSML